MFLAWATHGADTHGYIAQLEIFNCVSANLLIALHKKELQHRNFGDV